MTIRAFAEKKQVPKLTKSHLHTTIRFQAVGYLSKKKDISNNCSTKTTHSQASSPRDIWSKSQGLQPAVVSANFTRSKTKMNKTNEDENPRELLLITSWLLTENKIIH